MPAITRVSRRETIVGAVVVAERSERTACGRQEGAVKADTCDGSTAATAVICCSCVEEREEVGVGASKRDPCRVSLPAGVAREMPEHSPGVTQAQRCTPTTDTQ